jgi:cell division protein FtsW
MMKVAVTILITCIAGLLALGMVMLYSSSMAQVGTHYLVRQLVGCGVGLLLCVAAAATDYRGLRKFAWPLYACGVVLLLMVFVPHIGIHRNGASRWVGHGRTSFFQPSEVAKITLLIALAWYCERYQRQMPTLKRGVVIPGLFIGLVLALVGREPDVGTMLLLASVSSVMLLIAGIRLRYFLPPVIAGALALGTFIYYNPMRSDRVYSWLHLEETKQGRGLQAYQAMVALGSGGLTGKGLGDGRQKLGFVPEQYTDFIYSIIGEELGLIATFLILCAFAAVLFCGVWIARNAADTFGTVLGSGISFMIGLQAMINIGVVTSALPNKGLPLPFISFGSSNLVIMLLCVGILLSIARHARAGEATAAVPARNEEFHDSNPFKAKAAR